MTSRITAAGLAVILGALVFSAAETAHAWGSKKKQEQAQEEQKQQVSPEVAKALRAAQEEMQKSAWDAAYEHLREAQAVESKTPYDEFQIAEMLGYTELKREHFAEASAAFEKSIASGLLPPAEAANRIKLVAQIAMQLKDYPKAMQYATKAVESSATPDAELYALRGQAQYLADDFKGAVESMGQAVDTARKSGKPLEENWLQIKMSGYVKLQDEPAVLRSLQELAIAFPNKKYLQDLFNEWNRQHRDDDERSILNLHRLMLQQGLLPDGESYLRLAQLAVDAGMPGEAVSVLEQAKSNKTVADEVNTERGRRQMSTAKSAAATDRKALQDLEKMPQRSGEDDVQLGLALISFGEFARGADALQRGIAQGNVKRLDQAQILLGQALVKLNKPQEAKQAFESVDAASDLKTIAQLWQAYTTQPVAAASS